jgi:hypothetical protein
MITVRAAVIGDVDAVWPLARDLATSSAVDHDPYASDFALLVAEDLARASGAAYVALATRRAGAFYDAVGYQESATYFKKILRP